MTPDLANLYSDLQNHNVTEVGMESTSIYWLPVWRALEGISDRLLTNPYFIKQLPGRNSAFKDALWIAECVQKNLIRGSYVPIQSVQDLRLYNRRIFDIFIIYSHSFHTALGRGNYVHIPIFGCI